MAAGQDERRKRGRSSIVGQGYRRERSRSCQDERRKRGRSPIAGQDQRRAIPIHRCAISPCSAREGSRPWRSTTPAARSRSLLRRRGHRHSFKRPPTEPRPAAADSHAMRQETNIEVAAEPQPVEAKKAEAKKTDEHEDSDDDAAWWRLYRQEMPWEEYSSLSKGQKGNRRRRFQKAVAAKRPEKAVEST